ncbi:hypothetical protein [Aeromonas cavernicola]|uniref:Uncharacterized protein n=1 Tax=Aeromonas cavernicola TaxID=1006623 RepID=A0A2H9U8R3_9GAMM|nr:hypothetical protein [Aeromonas cavernicola]PJG60433.1 hypothetical protein CUC53_01970 [Aeromonas cavernicola]
MVNKKSLPSVAFLAKQNMPKRWAKGLFNENKAALPQPPVMVRPCFSGARVISIKFWSFITTTQPAVSAQNSACQRQGFKKTNQIRELNQPNPLLKVIQPVKKNVLPKFYLSVFYSHKICPDHRYWAKIEKITVL